MYPPNWQGNFSRQYPQAQWNQRMPMPPAMGSPVQNQQWNQEHRYPPPNTQSPFQGNQSVREEALLNLELFQRIY